MSKYMITVDTGTTNTRTFLWDENRSLVASAGAACQRKGRDECEARAHDEDEPALLDLSHFSMTSFDFPSLTGLRAAQIRSEAQHR